MARRKMAFNYSKFYTDFVMMSHVNSPNEAAQANANGRTDAQGLPLDQVPMDPSTASLNVELITTLRSLVEEQKRLIQQQTKFIDEKSEFIKLQNEFQERQSALIETQYSLKLE